LKRAAAILRLACPLIAVAAASALPGAARARAADWLPWRRGGTPVAPAEVSPAAGSPTPSEAPSGATTPSATLTPGAPKVAALPGAPSWTRAWGENTLLDPPIANQAKLVDIVREGLRPERILRVQVLLDRAHYSVGEIDAAYGSHTREAVAALQAVHGRKPTGVVDELIWDDLRADTAPILVRYRITARDLAGPFARVPSDMMRKAALPYLGYESPLEGLGEKFHSSPELLVRLNPGASFHSEGAEIVVPNVSRSRLARPAKVVVDGAKRTVSALDEEGRVLARYPATVGSVHDPLPVGDWEILSRTSSPAFYYNPRLFWDAKPFHHAVRIAPGPNSPVGVVWIELSKEHYAIHGTPEPSMISRTSSHGCIRLTNWDAAELAAAVVPGTPAILRK